MRICFTINCQRTKDDFHHYDELIKKGMFQGIEIFYPYNVSSEQRNLYNEELDKIVKNEKLEVVLHLPHGLNNDLVNDNYQINTDVIKRMKDAISYGVKYHAHKFTLHLGSSHKDKCERDKMISVVIGAVKDLCDYAKKYDSFIMIENMPRDCELGYGVKEMKYLLDTISKDKDNIKFIMDTGHSHVSSDPVERYIYDLSEYLYHIHFSDNNGLSDKHKAFHLGNIDFDKVFNALELKSYRELHCLEIIFNDYTDLIKNHSDISFYNKYYERWKERTLKVSYSLVARCNFNDDYPLEEYEFKLIDLIDQEFSPFKFFKKKEISYNKIVSFSFDGLYPVITEIMNDTKISRVASGVDVFIGAADYDKDYLLACHMKTN